MPECEHCNIEACPVLNKPDCPINALWKSHQEMMKTLEDIEKMLREGSERV